MRAGAASASRIPIAGIAGDQQAALFGQACHRAGHGEEHLRHRLLPADEHRRRRRRVAATTCSRRSRGRSAARPTTRSKAACSSPAPSCSGCATGSASFAAAAEIEALAASVPDNGGVYLVPAFAGLGAPHWDPYARGTIVGLTRGTTAAHIARAALESIAFQSADVLDAMQKDAGIRSTELRVDGGAARQRPADAVPGRPARRAGRAAAGARDHRARRRLPRRPRRRVWKSRDELAAHWKLDRRFEPHMAREEARRGWRAGAKR